ncbi:related to neutral amino acid permease [Ramularia collo-cygni]|uniref:Related to neutral amino acid permease n=1 Tax=Ramularia collo-cygni TaxID=112498 RepID=A0A2D3UX14_9PEZI|nr:related to neutral amino acid permease [Ramularia collo-cygni]CZT18855.1 related to neutral amino acid permease [Ramularia collo-cygni]
MGFRTSKHKDSNDLSAVQSPEVDVEDGQKLEGTHDAVFGEIAKEGGPNYRNVGWIGTVVLMLKTQIGLGVLSIPSVFDTLGLVPGIICLLIIAFMTGWSAWVIGKFKLKHPEVYGIDDVGGILLGKPGRIIVGIIYCLLWVFVAGSGMLSMSIGFNALSLHGTCTAVFVAVSALLGFLVASVRTLHKLTFVAWVGLFGILSSILVLTVAVGVQDRPASASREGLYVSDYHITNQPKFAQAISAVASLILSYAGTPAYFQIISEMRDPRLYQRSLIVTQSIITATYIIIGTVVYYYCGSFVASPALGSAGPLLKRICYGLALPGLLATTTLTVHIPAKYVFVRLLSGTKHMSSNSLTHWSVWIACTASVAIISYIIASAIPVFGGLVALIGALFGTLLGFQPMGIMWLYDNWATKDRSFRWRIQACWALFVIAAGTFLMIAGTYGAVVDILASYTSGSTSWSCADNSNST